MVDKTIIDIAEFAVQCDLGDHLDNLFWFVNDKRPNEVESRSLKAIYNELRDNENGDSYGSNSSY